jgi:pyrroloquinoline quinone biosynthesis protein A
MKGNRVIFWQRRIMQSYKQGKSPQFVAIQNYLTNRRFIMWTTPSATEMRFGFEVTMYVMNK